MQLLFDKSPNAPALIIPVEYDSWMVISTEHETLVYFKLSAASKHKNIDHLGKYATLFPIRSIYKKTKTNELIINLQPHTIVICNNSEYQTADLTEPLCPVCGHYIANCEEGHTTVTGEPDYPLDQYYKDKEQDDLMRQLSL